MGVSPTRRLVRSNSGAPTRVSSFLIVWLTRAVDTCRRSDHATDGTTLVLGGTGKTGRRIVERLTGEDRPVRIGTRSGGVPFDWDDRGTWEPALRDVAAVYVSYYPDLAVPGAPEAVGAFAELAVASGVRRLVLLSGRGEEEAQASEKVLAASGPTGPSCGAAGSTRTSTRATCSTRSSPARSCCRPVTSASRSSTPMTSPRSPRSC